MVFEYDEAKSVSNKKKHGIDFKEAQELWNDAKGVVTPAFFKKEERFRLTGKIDPNYWTAIFTLREDKTRIISARRARKNEKEYYYSGRV